jgi:hypothetical protein
MLFQPANSVLSGRIVYLLMNVLFFIFWLTCSAGVMYIKPIVQVAYMAHFNQNIFTESSKSFSVFSTYSLSNEIRSKNYRDDNKE